MNVKILREAGYDEAMLGLSLNKNKLVENMGNVANKLAMMDGGHNKFLESICVWIDITAPRYFWQDFDTYRAGVTKQSESTMHTITKKELTVGDFEGIEVNIETLDDINSYIALYKNYNLTKRNKEALFMQIKRRLPEGFLQRRVVCTNYKALRNIYHQRKNHRLPEWRQFCEALQELKHSGWVNG